MDILRDSWICESAVNLSRTRYFMGKVTNKKKCLKILFTNGSKKSDLNNIPKSYIGKKYTCLGLYMLAVKSESFLDYELEDL